MRPVVVQKAGVADERAFDGSPFIRVLGFEVGADRHRREEKYQEEIQKDLLRARELGQTCQISLPAACQALLLSWYRGLTSAGPWSSVHYGMAES
jgi:hypothetical protein